MDGRRFDDFARAWASSAASRRRILKGLLGGAASGLLGRFGLAAGAQDACGSAGDCAGDGDPCTAVECVEGQCVHSPVICEPGFVCVDAECVPDETATCPEGFADCSGTCTDLLTDAANCGGCGTVCENGLCEGGTCATQCREGLTYCCSGGHGDLDNCCVDVSQDPDHCGDCRTVCGEAEACRDGQCVGTECVEDGDCDRDDPCEAYVCLSDGRCSYAPECVDYGACCAVDGAPVCVEPSSDPRHCGGCGNTCEGGACVDGTCQPSPPTCRLGESCGDTPGCVDGGCCVCIETTDGEPVCVHGLIGAGGTPECISTADCAQNQVCIVFTAQPSVCAQLCGTRTDCPAGLTNCDGECVDTATESRHCGGCGFDCDGELCQEGVCISSRACLDVGGDCGPGYPCCESECVDGTCRTTCAEGTPCPPDNLVRGYVDNINGRSYETAYALLGTEMQQRQGSLEEFAAGYAETAHVALEIVDHAVAGPELIEVWVRLTAEHTDGSTHVFEGYYLVGREDGFGRILDADLREVDGGGSPPAVIEPTTGSITVTVYGCPSGMSPATLDGDACTPDPGPDVYFVDYLYLSDDAGGVSLEPDDENGPSGFTWSGLPFGTYKLSLSPNGGILGPGYEAFYVPGLEAYDCTGSEPCRTTPAGPETSFAGARLDLFFDDAGYYVPLAAADPDLRIDAYVLQDTSPPCPRPDITEAPRVTTRVTKATVTWPTDRPADSTVEYGATWEGLDRRKAQAEAVTAHEVVLSSLQPGTTYHYRVRSANTCGEDATTKDRTFVTSTCEQYYQNPAMKWCAGRCVDTLTDASNCGGCGNGCSDGQGCVDGTCSPPVPRPRPTPARPTPAPKAVKPGGMWIGPGHDFVVTDDRLHFAARAYPTDEGDPAIARVNFTARYPGVDPEVWDVACAVSAPTDGTRDVYKCEWDLAEVPAGPLTVSFDVYDTAGNENFAPHGTRTGEVRRPSDEEQLINYVRYLYVYGDVGGMVNEHGSPTGLLSRQFFDAAVKQDYKDYIRRQTDPLARAPSISALLEPLAIDWGATESSVAPNLLDALLTSELHWAAYEEVMADNPALRDAIGPSIEFVTGLSPEGNISSVNVALLIIPWTKLLKLGKLAGVVLKPGAAVLDKIGGAWVIREGKKILVKLTDPSATQVIKDTTRIVARRTTPSGIPYNISKKINDQIQRRGWSISEIEKAISNPDIEIPTRDTRWLTDRKLDDPATAYIRPDGHYVIRNDRTGDIVAISDIKNKNWKSPFK